MEDLLDRYSNPVTLSKRGPRHTIRCDDVVIKRFLTLDPLDRERIRARAEALKTLDHPGLARCHGVVEDGQSIALVYSWVEGETIAQMIDDGHRWSEAELYDFIVAICDAMLTAHTSDPPIVHRDLKPHNIVWTGERFVVIDFDAAREFADSVGNVSVIGTTGYAAPEQFLETVDRFKVHDGPIVASPVFGELTPEEALKLQLQHCAHHLSFLTPRT